MFSRRLIVYSGITIVIVVLFVVAIRPIIEARLPIISFVVPQGYSGWLVVAWGCDGGQKLGEFPKDGNRHLITFRDDGTVCLSDALPDKGYGIGGYQYPDGSSADVRFGGRLDAESFYAASPVPASSASPSSVAGGSGMVFTLASIGIGDAGSLGDRCQLGQVLRTSFGMPAYTGPCDPIPYAVPTASARI